MSTSDEHDNDDNTNRKLVVPHKDAKSGRWVNPRLTAQATGRPGRSKTHKGYDDQVDRTSLRGNLTAQVFECVALVKELQKVWREKCDVANANHPLRHHDPSTLASPFDHVLEFTYGRSKDDVGFLWIKSTEPRGLPPVSLQVPFGLKTSMRYLVKAYNENRASPLSELAIETVQAVLTQRDSTQTWKLNNGEPT